MGKVAESIFSGEITVIPMADVQHIEKHWYVDDKRTKRNYRGVMVITKHTKWSQEMDTWENGIYLSRSEADEFLASWQLYRHQLEINDLAKTPT